MTLTIQILLTVLLSVSIVAVIRLWSVLGSARVTLANLEATRQEADRTLKQLADVGRVNRQSVARRGRADPANDTRHPGKR